MPGAAYRQRVTLPRLVVLVLLLVGAAIAIYVAGEQTCPPASWVFWKRNGNFACLAGG